MKCNTLKAKRGNFQGGSSFVIFTVKTNCDSDAMTWFHVSKINSYLNCVQQKCQGNEIISDLTMLELVSIL